MIFELAVAGRYLRARRKQVMISFITVLSVAGITTGVAALIIILSVYNGMTRDLQKKILGATAHVTVLPSRGGPLLDPGKLMEALRRIPEVESARPAIYVQSLLSSGPAATGVVLKGVDPGLEIRSASSGAVIFPDLLKKLGGGRDLLLGKDLARRLGVEPSGAITVIVPRGTLSPMGIVPRLHRYVLRGVFETGLYDLDNGWGIISLEQARQLENMPAGSVQAIEVRVQEIFQVEAIQLKIHQLLGKGFSTTNWIEMNKPLFSALKLEKWGMFIAIALIVLVAALNIVTTLVLMVMEKTRDIGILRAMGASRWQIKRIFILQGMIIGLAGTLAGACTGIGLSILADRYRWISLDAQVYFIPYLPLKVNGWDVLLVCLAALAISFIATLHPSSQAVKINPVEAIRYE